MRTMMIMMKTRREDPMKNMITSKGEDEDAMTRRAAAAKYVRALQHRHQRLHCIQLQDKLRVALHCMLCC